MACQHFLYIIYLRLVAFDGLNSYLGWDDLDLQHWLAHELRRHPRCPGSACEFEFEFEFAAVFFAAEPVVLTKGPPM